MLKEFQEDRILDIESVLQLVERSFAVLCREPNVVHLNLKKGAQITIVGDIHGQLDDLLTILSMRGYPGPDNLFLFNGDFVRCYMLTSSSPAITHSSLVCSFRHDN